MTHFFNSQMAEYTTVNAAIVYSNMKFWYETNRSNGVNYFEDKFWFYSSVTALKQFHPYLGERAIRSAIELLVDKEFLLKGNFNKKKYDRTLWYSCTPLFKNMFESAAIETPNAPVKPIDEYIVEKAFIDRWNAIGFKTVKGYPTEMLSKIRSRLQFYIKDSYATSTSDAVIFFFEQIKLQPYLMQLSWFNLKYCIRNDEKFSSVLFHEHAWQEEKLKKAEQEQDLNTQGDMSGEGQKYSC